MNRLQLGNVGGSRGINSAEGISDGQLADAFAGSPLSMDVAGLGLNMELVGRGHLQAIELAIVQRVKNRSLEELLKNF